MVVDASRKSLLAVFAMAFTIAILWVANRPVIPKAATWEDVYGQAKNGGYRIIKTDKLWEQYKQNAQNLLLVDTRQEWEYRSGHIKDALNFPMEPNWWSRWWKRGALKKFLGPNKDRLIVFY